MDWLDLLAVQGTLKSLLQQTIQKHQFYTQFSLWSNSHIHIWLLEKPWAFVDKVMSLTFNMLSRLVIGFLPRSKHLLISRLQSASAVILEPKKINFVTVSTVSSSICHEVMGQMPWSQFSECWALSQLFHSPLSLSSRGSLVLCFLPWGWCHLCIWGYWYFSQQSWFQFVLHPGRHFAWCTLHRSLISRVTKYSLDLLLSWFGTSLLFHVQF